MVHKRTHIITFERPLDPQPPYFSRPYFYGIGDLAFFKGSKKVWDKKIPEGDLFFKEFISGMRVIRRRRWGWILRFEVTHDNARKVWEILFNIFKGAENVGRKKRRRLSDKRDFEREQKRIDDFGGKDGKNQ